MKIFSGFLGLDTICPPNPLLTDAPYFFNTTPNHGGLTGMYNVSPPKTHNSSIRLCSPFPSSATCKTASTACPGAGVFGQKNGSSNLWKIASCTAAAWPPTKPLEIQWISRFYFMPHSKNFTIPTTIPFTSTTPLILTVLWFPSWADVVCFI